MGLGVQDLVLLACTLIFPGADDYDNYPMIGTFCLFSPYIQLRGELLYIVFFKSLCACTRQKHPGRLPKTTETW